MTITSSSINHQLRFRHVHNFKSNSKILSRRSYSLCGKSRPLWHLQVLSDNNNRQISYFKRTFSSDIATRVVHSQFAHHKNKLKAYSCRESNALQKRSLALFS
ncbi:hypothetical protein PV326_005413 [Microctonus aethiopoides]|nr:hypothetical protein PV326_005413 [Microctonus aethiopoides]